MVTIVTTRKGDDSAMLVPNWRDVLRRAWSVRLAIFAGLLEGLAVAVFFADPSWFPVSPVTFVVVAGLLNCAAPIVRIIAQRGLSK